MNIDKTFHLRFVCKDQPQHPMTVSVCTVQATTRMPMDNHTGIPL